METELTKSIISLNNEQPAQHKYKFFIDTERFYLAFDNLPDARIRPTLKFDIPKVERDKRKNPLCLHNEINYWIRDKLNGEIYKISLSPGIKEDGATIHRLFWRVIGHPLQPDFITASTFHDAACKNHKIVGGNRRLASEIFKELLLFSGVHHFKAYIMTEFMDAWQIIIWTFGDWIKHFFNIKETL